MRRGDSPRDIGVILDSTGFLPGETGLGNLLLLASIRGKAGRAYPSAADRLVRQLL
nr:hypothetical protein [uncultured Acetatifactor sp.]